MSEEEGCKNRKFDVTYLERKLKLHILVYIIDVQFCKVTFILRYNYILVNFQ